MSNNDRGDAWQRRAVRVMAMVGELHKLGYQQLRIVPGVAPSGMYWRCNITPASNILKSNGALPRDFQDAAFYSTADENVFFGWTDATHASARALAGLFLERQPRLAERGHGQDWSYAGWYVQMLGLAEQGWLPIAYQDGHTDPVPGFMATTGHTLDEHFLLPMPPGGLADDPHR